MAPSVSRRRAMVERKRFSALTSVAIGRNSGGCAWLVRFEQVVDAQALILRRKVGVIGAPGAACIGKHQNALLVIHEGLRLGEIGRSGTGLNGEPVDAILTSLAHDATRAT